MEIVQQLEQHLWREYVAKHPLGNIFHTPEIFQVFAASKNHHPTLWAAIDDSNRPLVLMLPVQVRLMDSLLQRLTTRAILYGSVLCTSGLKDERVLGTLLRNYKRDAKKYALFTELRNLSDLGDMQLTLENNDFVYEDHLNFIVNLQRPIDEIWNSLDANARNNVNKARRKGVIIEEADSLKILQIGYNLLEDVYDRVQVPLADFSMFQAAFEILKPRGMARFFMARVDDVYIGTSIVLLYKDVMYGWYAGAIRKFSSYKAGDLLNWYVLEWGAQNDFSYFDFGGAGKPDEDYGPRKFKAKFGGELVNYGRNVCVHSPHLLKLSRWSYQLARRFL